VIKSSKVLSSIFSIVSEITGFIPSISGPTAATSGAFGLLLVLSDRCNNHPSGALNEISSSWFSKI